VYLAPLCIFFGIRTGSGELRDETKASEGTIAAAFQVLREARGVRRWLVFGGMDDTPLSARNGMSRIGRQVAQVAEAAIFLGNHAETAARRAVAAGKPPDMAFCASDLQRATHILREHIGSGDLILLKGIRKAHLTRIYYALEEKRFGPVTRWKSRCDLRGTCDACPELHRP
jgi:UDP-N-acetylmuramyl pentapeptide synthase